MYGLTQSFRVLVGLLLLISAASVFQLRREGQVLNNTIDLDCKQQYWLHPPKTGSTFCLSLQHVCCKENFEYVTEGINEVDLMEYDLLKSNERDFSLAVAYGCVSVEHPERPNTCKLKTNHHRPIPSNLNISSHHTITMLRDPRDRAISAFLDGMHHEGMENDDFESIKKTNFSGNSIHQLLHLSERYLHHPAIKGCQMKMLLGYECNSKELNLSDELIDVELIDRAKALLNQFFFVGIFENYRKSVELFHKMAGAQTIPLPVEYYQYREGDHKKADFLRSKVNFQDPYDEAIYLEAQRIFARNLQAYLPTGSP
jgi:hypothetical protein